MKAIVLKNVPKKSLVLEIVFDKSNDALDYNVTADWMERIAKDINEKEEVKE